MEKQRTTTRGSTRPRSTEASGGAVDSTDIIGGVHDVGGFGDTTASAARSSEAGYTPAPQATTPSGQQGQGGIVDRVKGRATDQLNTQKGRATEGLDTVAHAVRQTTEQLRAGQHDTIAEYIDKAAEQLERFSTRMREKDVNEILRDVQQFARRQPALFIGGSFAAGLLAARFLRSSHGRDEYAAPDNGRGYGSPRNDQYDNTGAY